MKNTIFFKTFLGYLLITIGVSALILFASFRSIKQHYINTLTTELSDLAKTMAPQLSLLLEKGRENALENYIRTVDTQTRKRVTIVDANGVVLADSENDAKEMANHKSRPEIAKALNGQTGTSIRYSSTIKQDMLYVAIALSTGNKTNGALRVSMPLKDINILVNELLKIIFLISLGVIFLSLVVSFFYAKSLSQPMAKLSTAAKQMAKGDFSARVHIENSNELKELSESFNNMAKQISTLFSELNHQKNELDTIINSIAEIIFVVDDKNKISACNESFKKLIENSSPIGRFYWETVRAHGFKELMEAAQRSNAPLSSEIEIGSRHFACTITIPQKESGFVVVLHDITKIKSLDNKKKEFVANVSHELRTPLTAIKGFAETLEESAGEQDKQYLQIINRHSERLIRIVEDLLTLSQIEDNVFKLENAQTDLSTVIANAVKVFDNAVKAKKLDLTVNIAKDLKPIKADAFRLEQLMINLIDNAVKYTEKGSIDISVKQNDKNVVIIVSDTGIGIAEENINWIFERFYVADKSRSRKSGGTGLGLSIVKHIVLLHNGSISVESAPGKGSKFIVTLPA